MLRYDLSKPFDFSTVDIKELNLLINAEPPDASALYVAAVLFYQGFNNARISETTALQCVLWGVEIKDPLCTILYAIMCAGRNGIVGKEQIGKDRAKRMFKWVEEEAQKGHVQLQRILGLMYGLGAGVDKDFRREYEWSLRAAEQGDAVATLAVALCHLNQAGGVRFDLVKARQTILQVAEKGVVEAQLVMAILLKRSKETEEAFSWLLKAAEQGRMSAQYMLSQWYAGKSPATTEDQAEAFKWSKRSADAGFLEALINIAGRYEAGEGIEKNRAVALDIYSGLLRRNGETIETMALPQKERSSVERRVRALKDAGSTATEQIEAIAAQFEASDKADGLPRKFYAFDDGAIGAPLFHYLAALVEQPSPHGKRSSPTNRPK
jgi:TPR repeat protein